VDEAVAGGLGVEEFAAAGEGFERGLVAPSMNSSDSPFAKRSLSHVAEKTRYVYSALTLPSLQKLDRDAV